jgi:hypothetical protein
MSIPDKGTSPLALITEGLPVRGRIGVVLMMAALALEWLRSSPDFPVARAAFDLGRRWYEGERFDPDRFEKAYFDEYDRSVGLSAMKARSRSELAAWSVIASAILYIAFQAYREIGAPPSPMVSEVEEDELDEVYEQMQKISPVFINTAMRTAEVFRQGQDASFAQLKAILSAR